MLRTTLAASMFALALLSAGSAVWASHPFPPLPGSRNCSGTHCTFVARWGWPPGIIRLILDATLSLDTLFVESGIAPTGPGVVKIPIEAGGQMAGKVSAYHPAGNNPPAAEPGPPPTIVFTQDGRVVGETDGLTLCYSFGGRKGDRCSPGGAVGYPDLVGTWSDAWAAFTDPDGDGTYDTPTTAVKCATVPDGPSGTAGRCTITQAGFTELVRIELRRTVEDPMEWDWRNADGTTPPPGSTFYGTSPFPGIMIATTTPLRVGTPAGPDLIAKNLSSTPASPKTGDRVTFSGTIRNTLAPEMPVSQTLAQVDEDANGSWETTLPLLSTRLLAPGAEEPKTWTDAWTAPAGTRTHRFRVCANRSTPRIPEPDDSDISNCSSQAFTVTERLACDPPTQSVSPNQTATLTASGGSSGTYVWANFPGSDGTFTPTTGQVVTVTYPTTGTKTAQVTRGSESSSCTVEVVPSPPLSCTPSTQRVRVGAPVSFAADPSAGNYTWTATGGSPETGSDSTFTTRYQDPGTHTVTVESVSSGQSDSCAVEVTAAGPTFPRGPVREAPP